MHVYEMYLTPAEPTFSVYYLDKPDCGIHVTSEAATRIESKTGAVLLSARWVPSYCAIEQSLQSSTKWRL